MSTEKSWLDVAIFDLPRDKNGEQLMYDITLALVDLAESLPPYAGVLAESMTADLDENGSEYRVEVRAILIARSSDGAVLYYDGSRWFCSLDMIGEKHRWTRLLGREEILRVKGQSNLRALFNPQSPVRAMTSRDLVTGIKALKRRVEQVASIGSTALEELQHLLSE